MMEPLDPTLREGIAGVWHYHLSRNGVPLCGDTRTMETEAPLDSWGFKPKHMPSSYCKRCEELRYSKTAGEER